MWTYLNYIHLYNGSNSYFAAAFLLDSLLGQVVSSNNITAPYIVVGLHALYTHTSLDINISMYRWLYKLTKYFRNQHLNHISLYLPSEVRFSSRQITSASVLFQDSSHIVPLHDAFIHTSTLPSFSLSLPIKRTSPSMHKGEVTVWNEWDDWVSKYIPKVMAPHAKHLCRWAWKCCIALSVGSSGINIIWKYILSHFTPKN